MLSIYTKRHKKKKSTEIEHLFPTIWVCISNLVVSREKYQKAPTIYSWDWA